MEYAELRRTGDDLELRLKVHYMPERVLHLPSGTKRGAAEGVGALMPRELAYLKHRRDGLSNEQIATRFDVGRESAAQLALTILDRLGVDSVAGAVELASSRIDAELHALPLEGRLRQRPADRLKFTWTAKRRAILRGLAEGKSRAQIVAAYGRGRKTLDNRIGRMKQQAGVRSDEELVAWAIEQGVIEPPQ